MLPTEVGIASRAMRDIELNLPILSGAIDTVTESGPGVIHRNLPATNIVTFCPGRECMTLNFVAEGRHIEHVPRIMELIEAAEAA